MKKLYFIACIALFIGFTKNLAASTDQNTIYYAQATPIQTTHAISMDGELATPERLNLIDANRDQSVNCSIDFVLPNDNPELLDESIKIVKNYKPNSLSQYDFQEFKDTSRNAATIVYRLMQNKLKETNEKYSKEIDQYKQEIDQCTQKIGPQDNRHPLCDPKRWTLLPLLEPTITNILSWNIPVVNLNVRLKLDNTVKTQHDLDILNRHASDLIADLSPYLINKNILKQNLQNFQTKIITDADQFNQIVTTKLQAQETRLNRLKAKQNILKSKHKEQQNILQETLLAITDPETAQTILLAAQGPFAADPKRWLKFNQYTNSYTISTQKWFNMVEFPFIPAATTDTKTMINYNPNALSINDHELMTAVIKACHSQHLESTDSASKKEFNHAVSIYKFQQQFNADADKLEAEMTTRLNAHTDQLNCAAIKVQKIKNDFNSRNDDGTLKELD